MGFNPDNFAYHIGTGQWQKGYAVYYAITFVDAKTGRQSPRSDWWDRKQIRSSCMAGSAHSDPVGPDRAGDVSAHLA
jgi:hypothetical protein